MPLRTRDRFYVGAGLQSRSREARAGAAATLPKIFLGEKAGRLGDTPQQLLITDLKISESCSSSSLLHGERPRVPPNFLPQKRQRRIFITDEFRFFPRYPCDFIRGCSEVIKKKLNPLNESKDPVLFRELTATNEP
jgi:hypothetical protein